MARKRPAGAPDNPPGRAGAPSPEEVSADPEQTEAGTGEDRPGPGAEEARADAEQAVERDLEELEATRKERDEYLELARRTKADFENYRKRVASEVEGARIRGRADLVEQLIPQLDNLERALIASGVDPEGASPGEVGDDLGTGVLLVHRELLDILERAGVEGYDPAGERFDPAWHEALSTRAKEGIDPGVVLETLEKGYRLDGQVLRAARVVVSE